MHKFISVNFPGVSRRVHLSVECIGVIIGIDAYNKNPEGFKFEMHPGAKTVIGNKYNFSQQIQVADDEEDIIRRIKLARAKDGEV